MLHGLLASLFPNYHLLVQVADFFFREFFDGKEVSDHLRVRLERVPTYVHTLHEMIDFGKVEMRERMRER
jgi:hypothetical protein